MKSRLRFLIIFASALLAVGVFTAAVAFRVVSPMPKVITSGTAAIGGPFTLTYRGKWLLIFFGYTYCPDACPTALNNISVALEKLGSGAAKLQPLFVTVDPRRDTRELMRDYLQSFDSRIIGLTGTQDQIDRVLKDIESTSRNKNPKPTTTNISSPTVHTSISWTPTGNS